MIRTCALSLLALLLLAPSGLAQDPVAKLTALLQESARNPQTVLTFIKGLGGDKLGDFRLDRADVARALKAANLPPGTLQDLLGNTSSLARRGGRIELQRDATTVTSMPPEKPGEAGSPMELAAKITARFKAEGADLTIDDFKGIRFASPPKPGKQPSFYDLSSIKFTREKGDQVAKIGMGLLFGVGDKTIVLPPTPPASPPAATVAASTPTPATPTPASTTPASTPGLTGALKKSHSR